MGGKFSLHATLPEDALLRNIAPDKQAHMEVNIFLPPFLGNCEAYAARGEHEKGYKKMEDEKMGQRRRVDALECSNDVHPLPFSLRCSH